MFTKKRTVFYQLVGVIASIFIITGSAHAERVTAPGYVTGSDGTIARDELGECMHTSSWKPEMAVVVGCDGVMLKAPTQVAVGGPTGKSSAFVVPAASMFDFDSAKLTAQGRQDLRTFRAKIEPELAQAFVGVIIGHTDSKGDAKYNVALSKRRAEAVRNYLIAGGIPANKLRVVGMGAKEPIASNNTEAGRTQNRRVEVIVFGEQRGLDVIHFPGLVLFPRLSNSMTPEGIERLEKKIQLSKEILSRAVYIEVIGHTDDVGDKKENQNLSELRAWAVSANLILAGVNPDLITSVGAGSSQPIASNQTEEGRAQNRRVEIIVLGRLK